MTEKAIPPPHPERMPIGLEKEESQLWRLVLLFVVLLATALTAVWWDRLQSLPFRLGLILPFAVFCVALAFASFSYGRRKQFAQLRELVHNLQDRSATSGKMQLDQMDQLILRSQRNFKELIDAFDDVAFACSLDGTMRTVNKRTADLLDLSYQEIVGHKLEEFLDEPKFAALDKGIHQFQKDQRWFGTIRICLKKDQHARYFECALNAMIKDGRVDGLSVLARDTTRQNEMEKELRQQQEFQRYLLESFPDLILVIGLDDRYSFVSARIRDLLGHTPEDLLGKKVGELPEDSREFSGLHREVSSGRKQLGTCEYSTFHRDGTARTMRATASPLVDSDGKQSGVIVSVRDITVEKKLEQQVIQSERLSAMGQMIGSFAHELNNPLTSILGMSELLQEDASMEGSKRQLELLHQQARRAAEIVQNLIFFSRPPAAGRTQINLNELLQRTLALHAYSLRKSNVTVDFVTEQSLPWVYGDSRQLMQVFLNLIVNAEQAIKDGSDRGTLTIRLQNNCESVGVAFQDNGPGIASDILSSIFDPFFTTRRPGRNTGLGLSVCRAILREHGGNVEASSGPGGGAVFTVTLPVTRARET